MTGEFTTERASNAEKVSIWWRHHGMVPFFSSQPVIEVPNADFVCIRDTGPVLISVGSLAGFLVVLVVTVSVVYKFRGEIKIILYFKCGWRPFDRSDDADILDKVTYIFLCSTNCLHFIIWISPYRFVVFRKHAAMYQIWHYNEVIMSAMASQITCISIVCSTVCSGEDQRKHHNCASLAFVMGIHRFPITKGQ